MGWEWHILASAVCLAFYDLAKKASVRGNAVPQVLLAATLFGGAGYVAALAAAGKLGAAAACDWRTLWMVGVKSLIVAGSWVFTYCALKTLPITVATPIRASAPALVFLGAFLLYGERPGAVQGAGMAVTFLGYWAFSRAGRAEGIDFLRNRAVWMALAGMVLSAASGLWDKFILQRCGLGVETVQFWFQADLVLIYAVLVAVHRRMGGGDGFEWRWTIPLVGLLLAAADWLYFRGLAQEGVMVSAASLMRRFSVAITFGLGAVFFRERNLRRKGLALVVILAGIVMIAL